MFLARLDEAKDSADKDLFISPNVKTNRKYDEKKNSEDTKSLIVLEASINQNEIKDLNKMTILEKCSEYLFDLFDANLTPEYHKINNIQEKAIKCFGSSITDKDDTEYTFEQQNIHDEFKEVFEKLISDFLYDEKISIDEFHHDLQKHFHGPSGYKTSLLGQKGDRKQTELANEILDCITWYTDFKTWAQSIINEVAYRKRIHNINSALKKPLIGDEYETNIRNKNIEDEKESDVKASGKNIRISLDHRFAEELI
mmetsp:Transcript_13952/g.13476  ORF Transcript_13952/g.13476 Transcript_13952/m.13476 type:complete len:255 (-) Transcript_13952:1002-1766(-)